MGAENELVTREFERMAQALAYGASTASPPLPLTALVIQVHYMAMSLSTLCLFISYSILLFIIFFFHFLT